MVFLDVLSFNDDMRQGCQVPKKVKKAKFGHKQFEKRQNSQMGKEAKFPKIFAKIYRISSKISLNNLYMCRDIAKLCLKGYILSS